MNPYSVTVLADREKKFNRMRPPGISSGNMEQDKSEMTISSHEKTAGSLMAEK